MIVAEVHTTTPFRRNKDNYRSEISYQYHNPRALKDMNLFCVNAGDLTQLIN